MCNQKQPDTEGRAALRKAQLCPRPAESEAHGSTSLSVQQALGSLLSLASPALLPCGHWGTSSGLQAYVANLGRPAIFPAFTRLVCVHVVRRAKPRASHPPGMHLTLSCIPAPCPHSSRQDKTSLRDEAPPPSVSYTQDPRASKSWNPWPHTPRPLSSPGEQHSRGSLIAHAHTQPSPAPG